MHIVTISVNFSIEVQNVSEVQVFHKKDDSHMDTNICGKRCIRMGLDVLKIIGLSITLHDNERR